MNVSSATSNAVKQMDVQTQIGLKVVEKAKAVVKQQGDAAVSLVKAAAKVHAAQYGGKGGRLDVYG